MRKSSFNHLHCHTGIGSIVDSTIFVEQLPKKAKELGHHAVAITEHGYLTSSVEFYQSCIKEEIKPILGCEMYVTDDVSIKDTSSKYFHLILLAKNNEGYENLKKLCTDADLYHKHKKPRIDYDLLKEHCKGLICSTACLGGELPKMIVNNEDNNKMVSYIDRYKQLFGDDFYLEVQSADNENQKRVNQKLCELAVLTKTKLIATSDVHFLNREDYDLHSVFIQINQSRDNEVYKDCWFKTEQEMYEVLDKHIGHIKASEAVRNTQEIVDKCEVELELGHSYLPHIKAPNGFKNKEEYFNYLLKLGLKERGLENKENYLQRVQDELDVIIPKGFMDYFLILSDLIRELKKEHIPIAPARGSAGGSLVCYLLKITEVDPIKYDLEFGRFLTLERTSLPDKCHCLA